MDCLEISSAGRVQEHILTLPVQPVGWAELVRHWPFIRACSCSLHTSLYLPLSRVANSDRFLRRPCCPTWPARGGRSQFTGSGSTSAVATLTGRAVLLQHCVHAALMPGGLGKESQYLRFKALKIWAVL